MEPDVSLIPEPTDNLFLKSVCDTTLGITAGYAKEKRVETNKRESKNDSTNDVSRAMKIGTQSLPT